MENRNKVLELLSSKKNVILMGAPGTGKSRLINEVAETFEKNNGSLIKPSHVIGAPVPIPAVNRDGIDIQCLKKTNRKVFRTTLHQNSKYRDFLTGIVPSVNTTGGFQINEGILYRANEFAKQRDSAALLIIDEMNRGPAIEVFGGSIVAIESDKRLSDNNRMHSSTQSFEIVDPKTGQMMQYAFSPNLYILAAMNQADVSVAPLDVAFLRRWQPFRLIPEYLPIASKYSFDINDDIPEQIVRPQDAFLVATKGLIKINELISVGRGRDYQLGQGVFLSTEPKDNNLDSALEFIREAWDMLFAHIEELFFGDVTSIAYVLNANNEKSPYKTKEENFAGEIKTVLINEQITNDNICDLYTSIVRHEE